MFYYFVVVVVVAVSFVVDFMVLAFGSSLFYD